MRNTKKINITKNKIHVCFRRVVIIYYEAYEENASCLFMENLFLLFFFLHYSISSFEMATHITLVMAPYMAHMSLSSIKRQQVNTPGNLISFCLFFIGFKNLSVNLLLCPEVSFSVNFSSPHNPHKISRSFITEIIKQKH